MKNNDIVPWVLNSVLSKYIPSPNPHVRQAACIWLLSLVKKLSHHKEIQVNTHTKAHSQSHLYTQRNIDVTKCLSSLCLLQSHLKEIQTAFISILSDPDGESRSALLKITLHFDRISKVWELVGKIDSDDLCVQNSVKMWRLKDWGWFMSSEGNRINRNWYQPLWKLS